MWLVMVHLYSCVSWPGELCLKWLRPRQVDARLRNGLRLCVRCICTGPFNNVCLLMSLNMNLVIWYVKTQKAKFINNVCHPSLVNEVELDDYIWMVVCNLHRWLLSKVMNAIVYVMCLLNSLMLSLRVISILCKCMIMRPDLHMLIIIFHTSIPRTCYFISSETWLSSIEL